MGREPKSRSSKRYKASEPYFGNPMKQVSLKASGTGLGITLLIVAVVVVLVFIINRASSKSKDTEKMIPFTKKAEKMIPFTKKAEKMIPFTKKAEKMIPFTKAAKAKAKGEKNYATAIDFPKPSTTPLRSLGYSNKFPSDFLGPSPAKAIKQEFNKAMPNEVMIRGETVIKPPYGVQPGTLVAPPVGEVKTKPLYDRAYGFESNFVAPYTIPRGTEKMSGSDEHADSNNGKGVPVFKSKEEARKAVETAAAQFDQMFTESLFPDAELVQGDADSKYDFIVKTPDGRCVVLERYYDYVKACISKEMGCADYEQNLSWARGSDLRIGFDHIDEAIPILRTYLTMSCETNPGYTILYDKSIQSNMTGNVVAYSIVWPGDMTEILNHKLTLE